MDRKIDLEKGSYIMVDQTDKINQTRSFIEEEK